MDPLEKFYFTSVNDKSANLKLKLNSVKWTLLDKEANGKKCRFSVIWYASQSIFQFLRKEKKVTQVVDSDEPWQATTCIVHANAPARLDKNWHLETLPNTDKHVDNKVKSCSLGNVSSGNGQLAKNFGKIQKTANLPGKQPVYRMHARRRKWWKIQANVKVAAKAVHARQSNWRPFFNEVGTYSLERCLLFYFY